MGAVPNVVSNLANNNVKSANAGIQNLGLPVMNNQGTPSVTPTAAGGATNPYAASPLLGTPGAPSSGVAAAGMPVSPISGVNEGNLNKQLTDTFGKGEGSLLSSEISNLGSTDSTYMQAYEKSMAPVNAENLATLNTTLSNEGVSGNSSAAAIANADFQTGITANEGLQAEQLQQTQIQDLLSLTTGLEGPSAEEVSSGGFLNDFGAIAGDVGSILHGGAGVSNLGSNIGAAAKSISGSSGDVPTLDTMGGSDPLNLSVPGVDEAGLAAATGGLDPSVLALI